MIKENIDQLDKLKHRYKELYKQTEQIINDTISNVNLSNNGILNNFKIELDPFQKALAIRIPFNDTIPGERVISDLKAQLGATNASPNFKVKDNQLEALFVFR